VPDIHPTFEKMVQRLERRSPLDEADRRTLLGLPHNVKKLTAGAHVVRDGDEFDHVTLLLSGFAYRYKLTGEGGRQIISFHCASEFLDLQNSLLGVADHNVQMLTRCDIAAVPVPALRSLAREHPAVGRAMWIETLIDAAIFREWIVNVGRRDSISRISHLLCELALRLEAAGLASDLRYEIPMTQEQIADCTGLTPVHVNRVLKELGRMGLIDRERRSISIVSWDRLREIGDFSTRYLHLQVGGPTNLASAAA
jgi:CRP-like cAMP-binding protein